MMEYGHGKLLEARSDLGEVLRLQPHDLIRTFVHTLAGRAVLFLVCVWV